MIARPPDPGPGLEAHLSRSAAAQTMAVVRFERQECKQSARRLHDITTSWMGTEAQCPLGIVGETPPDGLTACRQLPEQRPAERAPDRGLSPAPRRGCWS